MAKSLFQLLLTKMIRLVILLSLIITACSSRAQQSFTRFDSIPVLENGNVLSMAWTGGINFSQFSGIDVNFDGVKDLFAFDRSGSRPAVFIKEGIPGSETYRYSHDISARFPALRDWVLLRDFNCDGKEDIFTYGSAGIAVYKNVSAGTLAFEKYSEAIQATYSSGTFNLYASTVDLPAIVDADNDSDLDIITFTNSGSFVYMFRNYSKENFGHCDSLVFKLEDECWGKFQEDFATNAVNLNISCRGSGTIGTASEIHAGSTLTLFDPDKDGDQDALIGDISFNEVTFLTNGGTPDAAVMTAQDVSFPSYDTPVDLTIFPAAFYVDVNNDSKKDLLFSPFASNVSENLTSVHYYRNIGTTSDKFALVKKNFLQDQMIDVGEGAYPVLHDFDSDGDQDLFISNYGYFQGSLHVSKVALYANVGTPSSPFFTLSTRDYAGLSSLKVQALYPAFGDLDGDGDADMVVGEVSGILHYYRNTAGAGNTPTFVLQSSNFGSIDVGQFSTPQIIDVDGDGLLDLLIGERTGTLNYARNTGTLTSPAFSTLIENFGGVDVRAPGFIVGYSVPMMYDKNGTKELIVGSERGRLHLYTNITGNLTGNFNLIDSNYGFVAEGVRAGIAAKDLTNDGFYEMIVGNYAGGVAFYKGRQYQVNIEKHQKSVLLVYPNPATSELKIGNPGASHYEIYSVAGMKIASGSTSGTINVKELSEGLYIILIVTSDGMFSGKFQKIER